MIFLAILSTLLTLNRVATALTFTSPFPGTLVDLNSPFTVTWIPSSTDPSTFTLEIINTVQGSSVTPQTLATEVQTSGGTYIIPANTIDNYGTGFELLATNSSSGLLLASSGKFSLAQGFYSLSTSDGMLTIVGTPTQQASAANSASASATTTVSSAQSSAESTKARTKTSGMSPRTSSSTRVVSTSTLQATSSSSSSSSSTSSSSATATSSGSSDSNENLGFNSAADAVRGCVWVSCVAFLAVLTALIV